MIGIRAALDFRGALLPNGIRQTISHPSRRRLLADVLFALASAFMSAAATNPAQATPEITSAKSATRTNNLAASLQHSFIWLTSAPRGRQVYA
jgi:hypothetical protein